MENSGLGCLPAELRNLIYEHVLYEPDGANITNVPGILGTCRTIRTEAEYMYYAVNDFKVNIHEDSINHDLCQWLKTISDRRIRLVRSLSLHVVMPSIDAKTLSPTAQAIEEDEDDSFMAFLQLMHIMDSLRLAFSDRNLEEVVKFTLNGANDAVPFDEIEAMSLADQDRYRGAKFLILCLVHSEEHTLDAMEAAESTERLEKLDAVIRRRRAESVGNS